MDLDRLRGFVETAREKSFTRAAEKLFLTQPAVSLQVKALEDELGEDLFERRGKQILEEVRVIPTLHDDKFIAIEVLARHVPRPAGTVRYPADTQAAALAQRVVGQPLMGTQYPPVNVLDRARIGG